MLFGYETGKTWTSLRGESAGAMIHITNVNNCRFVVHIQDQQQITDIALDLSTLSDYKVTRHKEDTLVELSGGSFSGKILNWATGTTKEENSQGGMMVLKKISAERLQKASAYYRENFCKGRAF